jgi:hypothetical protein
VCRGDGRAEASYKLYLAPDGFETSLTESLRPFESGFEYVGGALDKNARRECKKSPKIAFVLCHCMLPGSRWAAWRSCRALRLYVNITKIGFGEVGVKFPSLLEQTAAAHLPLRSCMSADRTAQNFGAGYPRHFKQGVSVPQITKICVRKRHVGRDEAKVKHFDHKHPFHDQRGRANCSQPEVGTTALRPS